MIEFQSAKYMIEKWVDHWPILRINALQPYFFNWKMVYVYFDSTVVIYDRIRLAHCLGATVVVYQSYATW